jgi:Mrp family chromosome partitioning ATPase/capsular polysaccharide biosynthesis protein
LILFVVIIAAGSAYAFSAAQAKEYKASAESLLNPDATLINTAGRAQSDAQARFDSGQALVAHSPVVAVAALSAANHPAGITSNRLVAISSVTADPNSNVLTFAVTNRDPNLAVRLVNAYVDGYAAYSTEQLTSKVRAAIAHESQQITALSQQVAENNAAGKSNASLYPELRGLLAQRTGDQQTLGSVASSGPQVVRHADSASKTQPNVKKDLLLGLVLGLVLGVAAAFGREALDTRIRSAGEVSDALGLPLLARIPSPSRKLSSKHQLAMLSDSDQSSQVEAFRTLRVALDFANLTVGAKRIMVTSAIEREGKSTTVSNLAIALARSGRRTVLVDLDLRRPYIDKFFGLEGRPGVTDLALGLVPLNEAVSSIAVSADSLPDSHGTHANGNGKGNGTSTVQCLLTVVPAGTSLPPNPVDFMDSPALDALLLDLAADADIVLIDTPPLVPVADGISLSAKVDGVVIVAQTQLLRRPLLSEMARVLDTCRAETLGFVLTGAEAEDGYGYGYGSGYGYYGHAPDGHAAERNDREALPQTFT